MKSFRISSLIAALLAAAVPVLLFAYAQGPDAGYAGVPGESTCRACHSGGAGSGNVTVAFPNGQTYTPGVTQHLTVTISDPSQRRWGFQLTARQASSSSAQAGTFSPSDGNTQIVCANAALSRQQFGSCPSSLPLQYIEHTLSGTRPGASSPVTFAFDWTPPSSQVGNIVVYVAANAANGDGGTSGDHIYTANYTLTPAQPAATPSVTAVVNGASFQSGVSAASWITVEGANLAGSSGTWSSDQITGGKLPTTLNNVSVTINGQAAAVYYTSPAQLNVLAPEDATQGPVTVQVNDNGAISNAFTVDLTPVSPGFFEWSGKYAVATRPDYSLIGPVTLFPGSSTPVKAGETIILWGTGFGPTSPAAPSNQLTPTGQLYSVANPPAITIGGVSAPLISAVLAPGFAGLYQIAVQVPATVGSGDQPVIAQIGSITSPASVYISVQ